MHIYAFGSVCRGEIDRDSDIDLLAIVEKFNNQFDPDLYSIYSLERICELWEEGNPFSWHLASESKLIHTSDGNDIIASLGKPSKYKNCQRDCQKFYELFCTALNSIKNDNNSPVFELSTIFLAVRNFATCYMLGNENQMNFSRNSALEMGDKSLHISGKIFDLLKRARILSIRAKGEIIKKKEIIKSLAEIEPIKIWMEELLIGL